MQPNHQHADDVVLVSDDRCLCPLVSYDAYVSDKITDTLKW
jgi:hypothetical protein